MSDILDKIAVTAAQQKAMDGGCVFLPHGCRLFHVPQGWESAMIRGDKSVAQCDTLLSLEASVQDPEIKVIFLPHDALMTDEDIEKICQRNGATKTLFKEVRQA